MGDGVASFTTTGYEDFATFSNADYRGEDRISALHDDLLGVIISRLPVTDAARTAALASRWRHIWRSTPLVLRDADLPEHSRATAVAQILADHPGPFRTVILLHCKFSYQDSELGEWAHLLVAKGSKLANLYNKIILPNHVRLPADIVRCASLHYLFLRSWTIPADIFRGVDIIFPQLRLLSMTRIDMSNQDLEYLITACPVPETLMISRNSHKRVHICSQSLLCVFVGLAGLEEFAVVEAPLLERLYLLQPPYGVRIKIAYAPKMRVLGYLEPKFQKLQIGDTFIQPNTMVTNMKILALKVNFGVLEEVKILARFLRCFPNVYTLHIESTMHGQSATAYEATGELQAELWQEVSSVKCLRSHVKRMVIHAFRGDHNEFAFLKSIAMNAQELQFLQVVRHEETFSSTNKGDDIIKDKLQCLEFRTGISAVMLVSPKEDITTNLKKISGLYMDDPFRCRMHA